MAHPVAVDMREAPRTDALWDTLGQLAREGAALLHAFVGAAGLVLVVSPRGAGWPEEIVLGPGPFARPTRAGHQLFWGIEHALPPAVWRHASRRRPVRGRGLHLMPLGPVRGDVSESVAYQLVVLGDEIHQVRLRAGYKRRRVAEAMTGADVLSAVQVAERVTGTSPVAHAFAFSLAVEEALGIAVPLEDRRARVVLAELERITSHVGDLALLAASTAAVAAAADWLRLKEALLRFQAALTGHRYLRGVVGPGGHRRPLSREVSALPALLTAVREQVDAVAAALDATNSYLDRLHGAGRLPEYPDGAVYWTGFVGKSAGLTRDTRWDAPYADYRPLTAGLAPVSASRPDSYGRAWVRLGEIRQSVEILSRVMDSAVAAEAGPTTEGRAGDPGVGWGMVEAPRGRLCYRLEVQRGRVRAASLTTPSQLNWPAVPLALEQRNILQDFPIIDASFNLAVAALDL